MNHSDDTRADGSDEANDRAGAHVAQRRQEQELLRAAPEVAGGSDRYSQSKARESLEARREQVEYGVSHDVRRRTEGVIREAPELTEPTKDAAPDSRSKRAEIIDAISQRDGQPATSPVEYQSNEQFSGELERHNVRREDREAVLGLQDPRDGRAFVRDRGETLVTALHEREHQVSANALPGELNEGVAEYFAREKAGPMGELKQVGPHGEPLGDAVTAYGGPDRLAGMLDASVSRDTLERAHRQGDLGSLQREVDQTLGAGTYAEVARHIEDGDYQRAEKLLLAKSARRRP